MLLWFREGDGGSGNYVASGYSVYEEENEHLQEEMRAKASALKSVSNYFKCLMCEITPNFLTRAVRFEIMQTDAALCLIFTR